MLVPVALGQVRFTMPGLAANAQGVASGREMALRFATMDRLVSFLRLLSGATDLDASWNEMRLLLARSPLGLREMVVILPVSSIEAADTVAQAGRTAGGQCATGTGRHFVEYRNRRAPLGYDVTEVARESADLVFYGADQVLGLHAEGERSLLRLLLGLDLIRVPGGTSLKSKSLTCTVTARRGLGMPLCQGLVQAGVNARAVLCEPQEKSAFGLSAAFWLFRIENLPARLRGLVGETPGLNLFLPVTDGVAVAAGYRHPVNLAACRGLFPDNHLVLLSPRPTSPVVLDPAPRLADIAQLLPLPQVLPSEQAAVPLQLTRPASLRMPLRLVGAHGTSTRIKAAYVTGKQVAWLRRLCQALPASALRTHQVVRLEEGVLLISSDELAPLPFGQLLGEAAPGVLVPAGMSLQPAVDGDAMAQALGTGTDSLLVFPSAQEKPLRIPTASLRPLGQEILAEMALDDRVASTLPPTVDPWSGSLEVTTDPLGSFPLWGLRRK